MIIITISLSLSICVCVCVCLLFIIIHRCFQCPESRSHEINFIFQFEYEDSLTLCVRCVWCMNLYAQCPYLNIDSLNWKLLHETICRYIGLDWSELNWMCNACDIEAKFYADNLIEPSNDCWYGSFWLNFNHSPFWKSKIRIKIPRERERDRELKEKWWWPLGQLKI